jgi:OmpA family/Family of unknown function (DUF5995)
MAYLTGHRRRPLSGSLGCPAGCGCTTGGGRFGLSEWYVRDDEEDDAPSTSGVGFGCYGGCRCSCGRGGPIRLAEQYVRDDDNDAPRTGTFGFAPATPVERLVIVPGNIAARHGPSLGYGGAKPLAGSVGTNGLGQVPALFDTIGGFAFDKSDLGPPQQNKIIALARQILARAIRAVRLVGHTDPVGTPDYNRGLGQRRAEAVRRALLATLERMRPGSAASVAVTVESSGETQLKDRGPTEPERARNRRVEVFLPGTPPLPACRFDIRNAPVIEREAARRTLALSADVASRFIRTLGALGARGRFIPTVIDNKYWFAKLYEFITYYEIGEARGFRHSAFVLHFIPIFYDLYYQALENWTAGRRGAVSSLWINHFTRAGRPDNSSITRWASEVRVSIVTGVTAHVQGDMATALERTYRSYVAKYCLASPPPFDEFRRDFFEANRILFDRAKAAFLLHLSQLGPFPVGPEIGQFLFAQGEPLMGGLDIDEVYRWREVAWADARRRLGQ